jgi:S-DNA-T family DNA segregation ATPase FtsK/SpoIIIE
MKAQRIRIMAPIPGKGTVGVEIPNRTPRKVYLREVLTSEGYRRPQAYLKFALGVDVNGNRWEPTSRACRIFWWPARPGPERASI